MASIAVLPVLIGLAVDYAIQFQARFNEAREEGLEPARAATSAAARGGPVIGTACLATAAGFAVLALSPIPMVRSFGLLLVARRRARASWSRSPPASPRSSWPAGARAGGARRAPRLGAQRSRLWPAAAPRPTRGIRSGGKRALAVSIAYPGRVLGAAPVLAVCGWIAGAGTNVVSDIRDLAPSSLPALRDVNALQDETGVSGEVDVGRPLGRSHRSRADRLDALLPAAGARAPRLRRPQPELRSRPTSAPPSRSPTSSPAPAAPRPASAPTRC